MSVRIYGERLRDARVLQRLLSKQVAGRANLQPSQLTRLEQSAYIDVNQETALRLADVLGFPIEFLSSTPEATIKPGSTLFRARKTMGRKEEEQLHAWSRLAAQVLVNVLPKVQIPTLALPTGRYVDPQKAASDCRAAFGLNQRTPVPHAMRAIERAGVPIIGLNFDFDVAKHDAYSCWASGAESIEVEWPMLFVRTMESWEKTRFSIAHELGHLTMHRLGVLSADDSLEQQAHDFARHFLLPADVLRNLWPDSPTLNGLMQIKMEYGIALSAIIEHAWRLGLLSGDRRLSLYKQLSNRRDSRSGHRWREREPGWDGREVERPRLVARMLETALGEGMQLSELRPLAGFWPAIYLRRALASQIWSQGRSAADRDGVTSPNVVAFVGRTSR